MAIGAAGFLAGAAALANYSSSWREYINDNRFASTVRRITDAAAAGAVSVVVLDI